MVLLGLLLGLSFLSLLIFFTFFSVPKFAVKIDAKLYSNLFIGGMLLSIILVILASIIGKLGFIIIFNLLILVSSYGYYSIIVKGACTNKNYIYLILLLLFIQGILEYYVYMHTNVLPFTNIHNYNGLSFIPYLSSGLGYLVLILTIYLNYLLFKQFKYSNVVSILMAIFFLVTFPYVVDKKLDKYKGCNNFEKIKL